MGEGSYIILFSPSYVTEFHRIARIVLTNCGALIGGATPPPPENRAPSNKHARVIGVSSHFGSLQP